MTVALSDESMLMALFGLPPDQAIAYLKAKGLRITFSHHEMRDAAHARGFTVAKAMRLDVLRDIRSALLDALEQGQTLDAFKKNLTPLLQAKGWWGKQVVVDGAGNAQMVQLGSPRRLDTIYRTNLQQAYMAGREHADWASSAITHWRYVAVMDSRTRPSHAALHDKVWPKSHPIWNVISPVNGYNCRCMKQGVTAGQLKRWGLSESAEPEMLTQDIETTGGPARQYGVRLASGATMWVDPGFASSPLAGHQMDEILLAKAKSALNGPAQAYQLIADLLQSPARRKAWDAFVDNTLNSGIPGNQNKTMTVGLLGQALAQEAEMAQPLLFVNQRLLEGKKAARHAAASNQLSHGEWMSLPDRLAKAAPYRDKRSGNLILLYEDAEPGWAVQVAVDKSGAVDSVFRVTDADVTRKVQELGWWAPLKSTSP